MSNPFIRAHRCCQWHYLLSFFRYPFCECHYDCTYGRVIEGGCKYHD